MMKGCLYIALLILFPVFTIGQQVPFYSNSNLLPTMYNPSTAGLNNLLSVNVIRRVQWVGYTGAPQNNGLLADKKLSEKQGVGINIYQESRGLTSTITAKGMYAYHLQLNDNSYFDAGISLGYVNHRVKFQSESVVADANDPLVVGGDVASSTFDASIGLNYRWKKFSAGIAIPQIAGQKESKIYYQNERAYMLQLSHEIPLTYKVSLLPYAITRYVPNAPLQYDVKARIMFLDYWWIGTGYRSDYAVNLDFGANIKSFYIAYSYDISLNNYSNFGQSHEIVLGYKKRPKKKILYDDIE